MSVINAVEEVAEGAISSRLKLILIGVVAALLLTTAGTIWFLLHRIHSLEKDQVKLEATIDAKQQIIDTDKAAMAVMNKRIKADAERSKFSIEDEAIIAKARGTDADGPLAPVLRDELKRLRLRDEQQSSQH